MKLSKIKPNKANPRLIKDDKFHKLVKSLREFPEMMVKRPIVVDEANTILGGNMRYKALVEIYGRSGEIPDEWVSVAQGWTDEQKREFIIKDNAQFGEWDVEMLRETWDVDELGEWGVDLDGVNFEGNEEAVGESLTDKLKNAEYVEKENYFIKKPFIVIFYEDSEKHDLEKLLGKKIENDTMTYEQLK